MRRSALVLVPVSAAALSLAGIASAGGGGVVPPSPESPNAERIHVLYVVVFSVAGVVFLTFLGVLVAFVARGRRRAPEPVAEPRERRQLWWTVVPAGVIAAIAVLTFALLPDITDAPAAGGGQTSITVEAHQFYWLFRYSNHATTVNELLAPAGAVVRLDVVAPENDVVHTWWVPRLGSKVDAIPGRVNQTWFKAPAGAYAARCAALCGVQHTVMTGVVKVVPREQFAAFLDRGVDQASLGKQEFEGVCLTCHRLDRPFIGLALAGNSALTDRTRLASIVRNGVRTMPAVGSTWTDEQIDALYAYTKGLSASGSQG